jgi:hypothetical protein
MIDDPIFQHYPEHDRAVTAWFELHGWPVTMRHYTRLQGIRGSPCFQPVGRLVRRPSPLTLEALGIIVQSGGDAWLKMRTFGSH